MELAAVREACYSWDSLPAERLDIVSVIASVRSSDAALVFVHTMVRQCTREGDDKAAGAHEHNGEAVSTYPHRGKGKAVRDHKCDREAANVREDNFKAACTREGNTEATPCVISLTDSICLSGSGNNKGLLTGADGKKCYHICQSCEFMLCDRQVSSCVLVISHAEIVCNHFHFDRRPQCHLCLRVEHILA